MDVISGTVIDDPEELMINQEEFDYIEVKMAELLSELRKKSTRFVFGWTIVSRNFRRTKPTCEID